MNKWLLAAVLAVSSVLGVANAQSKAGGSVEDEVRSRFEQRFNAKPDSVTRTPFGLWEVIVGTQVIYVDQAVNYLISGPVYDAKTREDLTGKKRDELLRVDFASLPFDQAVKIVRGDGSRRLVTFADPSCGDC